VIVDWSERAETPGLRIGEVARRAGVATSTLRAWEARYGLTAPARTAGGQRLYREIDVARVRAVKELVDDGWSLAAAVDHVVSRSLKADAPRPWPPEGSTAGATGAEPAVVGEPFERGKLLDALVAVDAYAVLAAYEAVREILRAADAPAVRDAMVALVLRLGGTVGQAAIQDDDVLPVDVSFGEGEPLLPRARPGSLARMRLEEVLPLVVEDARALVHRFVLIRPSEATGGQGREAVDHGRTV
jgi:hypothetical protein